MIKHKISTHMLFILIFSIYFGIQTEAKRNKINKVKTKQNIEYSGDAPKENEVCFSPDEVCEIKLAKFIDSAQISIDIAIYDINQELIVNSILSKAKVIPVRIVVDKRQSKGHHSSVAALIKAGVNIRYGKQKGIMHNKFTIIDGQKLELGSFNYTNHAYSSNQENQLYISNKDILNRYKERFDKIWTYGVTPQNLVNN